MLRLRDDIKFTILPLTNDARQVFAQDMAIDGTTFRARIEIRYLPAPDIWVLSVWNDASGELLVNQIPVICSYGQINDLFYPFRHLRGGAGLGSLFVLRNTDEPSTADPTKTNLTEFQILFGDTL